MYICKRPLLLQKPNGSFLIAKSLANPVANFMEAIMFGFIGPVSAILTAIISSLFCKVLVSRRSSPRKAAGRMVRTC